MMLSLSGEECYEVAAFSWVLFVFYLKEKEQSLGPLVTKPSELFKLSTEVPKNMGIHHQYPKDR